jgi:hypothetical protein
MDGTSPLENWTIDPIRWPAGYFYEDQRFRKTDDFWRDYLGALTSQELIEFRERHNLHGRDHELDQILDSGWSGRILVYCGEWEGG